LAVIRPRGKRQGTWALPKGHVEPGEPADATAVRETLEETGLETEIVAPLGDSRYTYRWDGEQVAKRVHFYLLRPIGGTLGAIPAEMADEVAEVAWIPLDEAPTLLAYRGERDVARRAVRMLRPAPLPAEPGRLAPCRRSR
jgi:8-oxo-dGTP pyrophosphatase MutT (NUDIX family)